MTRSRSALPSILVVCALLLPACGGGGEDLAIEIVSPGDGDVVAAGEPVAIRAEITGGHIQGTGGQGRPGHLHVFVDRELVSMTDEAAPTVTLEPGEHEIMVEFSDENHVGLGITDRVDVTAE